MIAVQQEPISSSDFVPENWPNARIFAPAWDFGVRREVVGPRAGSRSLPSFKERCDAARATERDIVGFSRKRWPEYRAFMARMKEFALMEDEAASALMSIGLEPHRRQRLEERLRQAIEEQKEPVFRRQCERGWMKLYEMLCFVERARLSGYTGVFMLYAKIGALLGLGCDRTTREHFKCLERLGLIRRGETRRPTRSHEYEKLGASYGWLRGRDYVTWSPVTVEELTVEERENVELRGKVRPYDAYARSRGLDVDENRARFALPSPKRLALPRHGAILARENYRRCRDESLGQYFEAKGERVPEWCQQGRREPFFSPRAEAWPEFENPERSSNSPIFHARQSLPSNLIRPDDFLTSRGSTPPFSREDRREEMTSTVFRNDKDPRSRAKRGRDPRLLSEKEQN